MEKSRLFICGDSWAEYHSPPYFQRWPSYLETHYEVYNFGKVGLDNTSIIYQIGNLPSYTKGDRLIIVFTDPSRLNKNIFSNIDSETKLLNKVKVNQSLLWDTDFKKDEINFYKKIKHLLKKWGPIFVTWNGSFFHKTENFVKFLDVSTLKDEGHKYDLHPGILGNYQIYCKMMDFLGNTDNLEEIRDYSII